MQSLIDKLKTGDGAVSAVLWFGIGLVLLVVVVLIVSWLIRILRPTLNMSGASPRGGRVQRLAITDAFPLDRDGRKLVIVRRDNVEHLLLIGGPNDVLVEANFTRSDRARSGRPDMPADAIDAALDLPPAPPAAVLRPQAPPAMPVAPPAPAPVARPAPSPARPAPPVVAKVAAPAPHIEATPAKGPAPEPPAPIKSDFDQEFEAAMRVMDTPPPVSQPTVPVAPRPSAPLAPAQAPAPTARAEPMSEMARRLSEVLQKPVAPSARAMSAPVARPVNNPSPPPAPQKLATDADMDALEEEMARLLGRPGSSGKPGAQ